VVITDSIGNRLFYGDVNSDLSNFISLNTVDTVSAPQKVAIAPDGQTLLVGANDLEIYRLTGAGGLIRGTPPTLPVGAFSFAFEPTGNRVYALSAGSTISILRVESPGVVSVEAPNVVTVPTHLGPIPSSGIDMLGITPDGQRLVVGDSLDTYVHVVRLSDLSLSTINTGGKYPTGIAVFQGVPPEPTTTPTSTSTPTPTATPVAIPQVAVPTLSSPMLGLLALILAALALRLLRP
jgi:WD40 repeat protein